MTISVGVDWRPAVAPAAVPLWEEQFTTAAATTTAFKTAYVNPAGAKWNADSLTFNIQSPQWLDAVSNAHVNNLVVSAASAGGTGNSLKLQGVRGTFATGVGDPTSLPFSSGGIVSRVSNGFSLKMGQTIEVRQRFTNGALGGTAPIGGHRPCLWCTTTTLSEVEDDFPEYFGSNGTGSRDVTTGSLTTKQHHYVNFWTWGSGTGFERHQQLMPMADTNWHTYTREWRPRSLKYFIDGQLIQHLGDPPWDSRAVYAPYAAGTPYKWASAYQLGAFNNHNYIYPDPWDASNTCQLRLTMEVGGIYCHPLEPAALAAAAGTTCYVQEVDHVKVWDSYTLGAL